MSSPESPSTVTARLERLGPALLALATFALYLPTLQNGLTNWDDLEYVTTSPFATKGLAGVPLAWTQPLGSAWYPLTHTVYCLLHAGFGDAPWPYHLAQVLLFALAVALVPAALGAFGVERRSALLAAFCWAVHPLRVESVSWAANLKDTLSLALVLVAFAVLPRSRVASVAAFVAALLAKSTVFPLALLLAALDGHRNGRSWKAGVTRGLAWALPAAAAAGIAAWAHLPSVQTFHRTVPGGSLIAALPSVLVLPWHYAAQALSGRHPQALYDFEPVRVLDGRLALALLAWGALAVFVLSRRPRAPALLGALAFTLPFVPVTGLVPLVFHVADRYALLPSLAVDVAVVLAMASLAQRRRWRHDLRWLPAAVSLLLVPTTLARQGEWRSGVTLWEADRGRSHHLAARINLAGAYGGEGRFGDAARELAAVVELSPGDVVPLSHLVFALAAREGVEAGPMAAWVNAVRASRGDRARLEAVAQEAERAGASSVATAVRGWRGAH